LAGYKYMVPRTFGKQIIFGFFLCVLAALLILWSFSTPRVASSEKQVYIASDEAMNLSVLDGITAADNSEEEMNGKDEVKAVIVPHHLVASKSIALGIKTLALSKPDVVVIISPDHYGKCPKMLCTSNGSYRTFFGETEVSEEDVSLLKKTSDIIESSTLFSEEHGIYSVVPFIKHYLPNAQILPLVISQKSKGSEQDRKEMLSPLEPILSRKDVGVIVSSDFSHYLPLAEANKMDTETQSSFCSGDDTKILKLQNPSQSDCPLCLWLLEKEAQKLGFWNPEMLAHTNSAELLEDRSAKETTSHFVFALSTAPTSSECAKTGAKILIVGDMVFDRYIRQTMEKHGTDFPLSCVDDMLKSADLVVGNLEGPITDFPSVSVGTKIGSPNNFKFTFSTTTAEMLFRHNIKLVTLGNNHINNFGKNGIASTGKYLEAAGVSFFGGLKGSQPLYRTELNSERVSFVSYNQFSGDPAAKIAETITEEKAEGRTVIVYTHWGEEYIDPPEYVRNMTADFAKSGADIIIGSHPHVVLSHEQIGDTIVYYSLGNFVFDQYFSKKVRQGLALELNILDGKISIVEHPTILETDGRTCEAE